MFGHCVGKILWRRAWQPTQVFLPGDPPWTEEPGGLQSVGSQRVEQAEQQGKPKNTGVGNLSLLQQIFHTQESNQGLLHCRQILDQLSYRKPCYNMLDLIYMASLFVNFS